MMVHTNDTAAVIDEKCRIHWWQPVASKLFVRPIDTGLYTNVGDYCLRVYNGQLRDGENLK